VNLSPFKLTILLSRYLTSFFGSWNIIHLTGKITHICKINWKCLTKINTETNEKEFICPVLRTTRNVISFCASSRGKIILWTKYSISQF
jgi:hypothetical protein